MTETTLDTAAFTWSEQQTAIFAWFSKDQNFFDQAVEAGQYDIHIDAEGHLVVRARAGTGKTTVIIEGVKRSPSRRILICAFSKIIQEELQARIGSNFPHITAQTLHSVGLACVRQIMPKIRWKFTNERADWLTDQVCGEVAPDQIKRLVSKLHTKGREIAPHAKRVGDLTAIAITHECEPEQTWARSGFGLEYVETKALEAMVLAANVKDGELIDGSDMIFLPVRNGLMVPMYDEVVVDEAQDMTVAQLEIARGVLRPDGRMAVVGDNRQAIFAFRGADSDSLDRLKGELGAGELGLTQTRRCGRQIVALASTLVPDFEAADTNPDGSVEDLHRDRLVATAQLGDFILSRTNAPLVPIAIQLLREKKRARVAGQDIGRGLKALVRKLRAVSVEDFLVKIEAWRTREEARVKVQMEAATNGRKAAFQSKIETINDQAAMLVELSEGATSMDNLNERIDYLFTDDGLGEKGVITCSSVHRAKGLEADRVFVLADTLRSTNQEELNIQYVAYTRAKSTLVLVHKSMDDRHEQRYEEWQ